MFLLGAALATPVAAQTTRTITVDGHRLQVAVPAGYSFAVEHGEDGELGVRLDNPVWRIGIQAMVAGVRDPQLTDPQAQRDLAISNFAEMLGQSRETDYHFQPLEPREGTGTYFVFTDAKYHTVEELPPNEYLHLTAGVRVARGVVIVFSIVSNDTSSPEYREALALFRESFLP